MRTISLLRAIDSRETFAGLDVPWLILFSELDYAKIYLRFVALF